MKRAEPAVRPFFPRTPAFQSGDDSPRKFLEDCLGALNAYESEVRAFVHLDVEGARRAADLAGKRWRDGRPLSIIDGMPVGIKDIVETIDMPTEQGSPLFRGWMSGRDAASVAAMRDAGAIILGKTVTTEFAATEPGKTCNPWDVSRTPGGSSSGSAAAVSCGMLPAASGTQVIGSILRPASYCGCIGYKASLGAINRGGSHDSLSQSCWGVLAASLEDAWHLARVTASRAGGDPGWYGLAGPDRAPPGRQPRALAVLRTAGWMKAAPEARLALERAGSAAGKAGLQVRSQDDDALIANVEHAIADAAGLSRKINAWESRWPLNTYFKKDPGGLSATMKDRLRQAEAMTLEGYRELLVERSRARALYGQLREKYDACISLAASGVAPVGLASTGDPTFAVPSSLLGVPAISLPLFRIEGLPLGLQVVGFEQHDAELFSFASWIQDLLRP